MKRITGKRFGNRRRTGIGRLAAGAVCGWLAAALALPGCAVKWERLSAEQAFARSASALSGYDRFKFDGEVALYDPNGNVAEKAAFRGKVADHKPLALEWEHGRKPNAAGPNDPFLLLKAVQAHAGSIAYEPAERGDIVLKVTVRPEAAAERIKETIRMKMASVRAETQEAKRVLARTGTADDRRLMLAERKLSEADAVLAKVLPTLKVSTVCRWTADSRTWFPREMAEESVIRYTWNGKVYTEKRTSVTNFRLDADSGKIGM